MASIPDIVVAQESLSVLESVVTSPGYEPVLTALGGAGLTLFAPDDSALAAAGLNVSDVNGTTDILQYHVLASKVLAADVTTDTWVEMLNGAPLKVVAASAGVTGVDDGAGIKNVTTANLESTNNGVVHIIDGAILPPKDVAVVAAASGLNSLLAAVIRAGLASTLIGLEDLTVLAPTDAAFATFLNGTALEDVPVETLTDILTYHVFDSRLFSPAVIAADGTDLTTLGGKMLTVDISIIELTDVLIRNGVVHVINTVLVPPTSVTTATSMNTTATSMTTVMASSASSFSLLMTALAVLSSALAQ